VTQLLDGYKKAVAAAEADRRQAQAAPVKLEQAVLSPVSAVR
jgi:hypothetical protein